jgi:hypothetical protein
VLLERDLDPQRWLPRAAALADLVLRGDYRVKAHLAC